LGTSELTFFKVVIWFACISFWESKDTADLKKIIEEYPMVERLLFEHDYEGTETK
jgi:hypothetical protein